ncbi:MAG: hypothetical protein FWC28_00410, partial [Proteobacteria bacterium]|nr:hypothetical protein [Cystobacterineae bacterium]MCL2259693.1 hypothetical protein [Cystobacterineae bacterium]MCL2313704.1 hypothetical protein [Pseudomonadota bacterium]
MQRKAVLFLWVLAFSAWAQQVVVLEFKGDMGMRLGRQIENALWEYEALKPMPLEEFVGASQGLVEIKTAANFARAAAHVREVSIAVFAKVEGNNAEIFIWDRAGNPLWSRRLPLEKGLLTPILSQRLARAIVVAVGVQGNGEEAQQQTKNPRAKTLPPPTENLTAIPSVDFSSATEATPRAAAASAAEGSSASASASSRRARFLRVSLLGAASWHSLCARPGVNSCEAFDRMSMPRPAGATIGFSSGVYAGAFVQAEYFPLALYTFSAWRGLGVRVEVGFGQATKDFVSETNILLPQRTIQEVGWSAEVLYRYFFLEPSLDGIGLHASVRMGYAGKDFLNQNLPAPNIRRRHMGIGVDAEVALLSFLRLGINANIFIQPKPGDSLVRAYGKASSIGYRVVGAISGEIYGPLGYRVEVAWNAFRDIFSEASQEWECHASQCGGVTQETYLSLGGGLQLEF